MWKRTVAYEQAVYGSFPFWNRGYAVLARSANCRPEWLMALKLACQRFGERPRECGDDRGSFVLPIQDGPWMIVGVFPAGRDDQGRPGALVFHARFVEARGYRKTGYDPFPFLEGLRGDWSPSDVDSILAPGILPVDTEAVAPSTEDDTVREITRVILRHGKVIIPSATPADRLIQSVWRHLPGRTRSRISVATFAYDNGNQFDLVALPGLRAAELARSRAPESVIITPVAGNEVHNIHQGKSPLREPIGALEAGLAGGPGTGSRRFLGRLFR